MLVTGESAVARSFGGFEFRSLAVPSRGSTEIALWTVDVPEGGDGTPHRASKEEVFYVLSGSVTIQGQTASAGDAIVVPPAVSFALAAAGEEPLRAICCLPVGGQGRLGDDAPFTPPWAE